MMIVTEQNRTDPFTVHELAYILFKQIEHKRNYIGLALCISFIMWTFWLSVRFRMRMVCLFMILGMAVICSGPCSNLYIYLSVFLFLSLCDYIPQLVHSPSV